MYEPTQAVCTINPTTMPIMLTTKTPAEILNVSEKQIRDLCREDKIHAVKVGNVWRIPRDAFLKQFGLVDPS